MISNRPPRNAFTLVELMIVIVILGLLASLLVVAAGTMTDSARSTEDSARLRSIAMANVSFATDNDQRLLSPRTEPNIGDPNDPDNPTTTDEQVRRMWVHGFGNNVSDSGSDRIELSSALSSGAAWEYLGDETLYKSPLDPTTRIRSYSLNAFIGVDRCADEYPAMTVLSSPAYNTRYRLPCPTQASIPQPAKTICAIGEILLGFGGYQQTANVNGWLVSPNPNQPLWTDTPALWNRDFVNISQMDGSVQSLRLMHADALRAKIAASGSSHNVLIGASDQDKVDFQTFNSRLLPGVLEFRTASDQE
ncbi:MAG: type II secretion system GspH family protein [Phycisphaerales bacterium]|nr:type II secretion system GspH family protein [Phycisphaerales bacterium]